MEIDEETGLVVTEPPVVDKTKRFKKETSFRLYRFLRVLLLPFSKLVLRTKIINKENAYKVDGGIYALNHYSTWDSIVPYCEIFKKEVHVLAKYELFYPAIRGWILTKMGGISVRRGEADIEAAKACLNVLKDGKKLLIYPEGTRNKLGTQEMTPIKIGTARFAIKTHVPIVPMMYYRPPKWFRKNWLYVGEPFTLEEYYDANTKEQYQQATNKIAEKLAECRAEVNKIAEKKKK